MAGSAPSSGTSWPTATTTGVSNPRARAWGGLGAAGRTPWSLGTTDGGCFCRGTVRPAREPGALVDGAVLQQVPEEGAVYCQPLRQLHRLQPAGETTPLARRAMAWHSRPRGEVPAAPLLRLCPARPW